LGHIHILIIVPLNLGTLWNISNFVGLNQCCQILDLNRNSWEKKIGLIELSSAILEMVFKKKLEAQKPKISRNIWSSFHIKDWVKFYLH